jgi:hypothetical protein
MGETDLQNGGPAMVEVVACLTHGSTARHRERLSPLVSSRVRPREALTAAAVLS